eukprot:3251209-Amphidinium_carterae.1
MSAQSSLDTRTRTAEAGDAEARSVVGSTTEQGKQQCEAEGAGMGHCADADRESESEPLACVGTQSAQG